MRLSQAVAGGVETMREGMPAAQPPASMHELVELYGGRGRGGGVGRVATELGISQRSVERYLKRELGEGGQQRAPNKNIRERIRELSGRIAGERSHAEVRKRGADVVFTGMIAVYSDKRRRYDERERRNAQTYIPGEQMAPIFDALAAGRSEDAADLFTAAFLANYIGNGDARNAPPGAITEVDALDFYLGKAPAP